MRAGALATELLELLLPRGCLGCAARIPPEEAEGLVCQSCRLHLKAPPPPFCSRCQIPQGTGHARCEACPECAGWPGILAAARAAVILDTVSGSLVHSLKYGGWAELAGFMAVRMAREVPGDLDEPLLAPVPTTSWRRRTRGYNQAALLADALSSLTSIPLASPLRRRGGRTQVRLGFRQRRENVRNAFQLEEDSRSRIQGREVILVDDVLTTGATALSCVLALEAGGVKSIRLITFARSLPYSEKGIGKR